MDFPATLRNVVEHFVRMENVDLELSDFARPEGPAFRWAHRVAKALAKGQSTIKAVRMKEVPPPDEIVDSIY